MSRILTETEMRWFLVMTCSDMVSTVWVSTRTHATSSGIYYFYKYVSLKSCHLVDKLTIKRSPCSPRCVRCGRWAPRPCQQSRSRSPSSTGTGAQSLEWYSTNFRINQTDKMWCNNKIMAKKESGCKSMRSAVTLWLWQHSSSGQSLLLQSNLK